ncbi:MAG: carboxylating nicotinate-nucleotide diphosphorylase [Cytophaga sp.]|uniref:carboxylating nicotinate-nucleotide diphosphorylase n=1 Tax=Cytophaga sp. TaxID=29535 RepID=UPI003F7DF199
MQYSYITPEAIDTFIHQALQEDVGDGDHTSLASIPKGVQGRAQLILKDSGILAGMDVAKRIFECVDPALQLTINMKDGDRFEPGQIALTVSGSVHSILTAERLVLNTMQRMSGIASYTNQLQSLIAHTKAKVLDTRKTTPNFRMLEKWAVKIGGGVNHRYGLFDMILLKDNHVDFAGGIKQALQHSKKYIQETGKDLRIEIETRNLKEVQEALEEGGAFRIMLDNMSPAQMKEAVLLINHKAETEASGGINENTIVAVAESGVDYISIGSLSHSYKSKDMSLKAF